VECGAPAAARLAHDRERGGGEGRGRIEGAGGVAAVDEAEGQDQLAGAPHGGFEGGIRFAPRLRRVEQQVEDHDAGACVGEPVDRPSQHLARGRPASDPRETRIVDDDEQDVRCRRSRTAKAEERVFGPAFERGEDGEPVAQREARHGQRRHRGGHRQQRPGSMRPSPAASHAGPAVTAGR
jgi:hypothetical protein